jgi:2-oxoacid:acceptor oxidoreductase gamma subunit (pyruvate/2-ketoisovalerate family)
MIEIRIHGRGGQGGVTLAKIIATSRFLQGQSVQAFGLYAAERSGAPIQSFCRFSDETIHNRNIIYEPDHVIVLDPTLIGPGVVEGLDPGGWLLVNTADSPATLSVRFPGQRIATVDATSIARRNRLGTRSLPIVNTALAGATARMLGFELADVHAALEHLSFTGGNLAAASQAYDELETTTAEPALQPTVSEGRLPGSKPRSESFLDGKGGLFPTVRTGNWATQQPHRQQMAAPCNHVCPAGNDVRGFLQALAREQIDEAAEILFRTTPFPAVCGRVCPAPCMDNCNRIGLDEAVNVRELERYVGDKAEVSLEATNGRVENIAIIGSGPAGLTAAYHLARFGYPVTLYEAGAKLGGLLRTGIPGYRLPEDVLDRELGRILSLGVEARTEQPVDRARLLALTNDHDAVLVATGLQELRDLRLGSGNGESVDQGIEFLARSRIEPRRLDGQEIVVVGGGNTAVDAARTALRLGAESVRIVYRRTRSEMPAIQEEIDQALEEGIELLQLILPVGLTRAGDDDGRTVYALTCRSMELGEPDDSGRRRPIEIEGSDFDLSCHRVILALGQSPDLSVFPDGTEVHEGEELLGLLEKPVFAIGDLASGDGTVAAAIGSGRRAALHIHQTLSGESLEDVPATEARRHVDVWRDEVVRPEAMRLHLFERQAPHHGENLQPWQRTWNFEEVHQGLPDLTEARRCLSCGGCNECDRCITYCPEGVLKRVGSAFEFDYSFCKGCGVCAAECPRNVIFMSHL